MDIAVENLLVPVLAIDISFWLSNRKLSRVAKGSSETMVVASSKEDVESIDMDLSNDDDDDHDVEDDSDDDNDNDEEE